MASCSRAWLSKTEGLPTRIDHDLEFPAPPRGRGRMQRRGRATRGAVSHLGGHWREQRAVRVKVVHFSIFLKGTKARR